MAPKKGQKMSLGAFLDDGIGGSWADEMESLPNAPAQRGGDMDSQPGRLGGRAADAGFGRSDRTAYPPREDLPLPTQAPYTAFVGNLAFDLTETDLEQFFSPLKTKSIKVIKDRDERPKGFGYIEFEDLEGLKDALSRSGQTMAGRGVRVSVAEPPKERSGFGGVGGGDDEKFANPWRRDGPLPDLPGRGGDGPRRRFEGERAGPPPSSNSDGVDQWRSSRPAPKEFEPPPFERKRSGFPEREAGLADTEETWSKGSRFKPSEEPPSRGFGSGFRRQDSGGFKEPPPPQAAAAADEPSNWRSARPARVNSQSPTTSTPPTPQMGRRKLELLPRNGPSAVPSPLSSPRMGPASAGTSTPRSNPFGDAKPVDVSARDKEITERVEKDREAVASKVQQHTMSRSGSKGGFERTTSKSGSPRVPPPANIRPAVSFASALATKGEEASTSAGDEVADVTEKLSETTV